MERHAFLHCYSGLQATLYNRWNHHDSLKYFLLLSIQEACEEGLFGHRRCILNIQILKRLGDYVAISTGHYTLVTPEQKSIHKSAQGAHGSLLPEEMKIPFILCKSG